MSYTAHRQTAHRNGALRPVRPAEHPPLPITPSFPAEPEPPEFGAAPGSVIRFETAYHGQPPVIRCIDGSGRVLYDAIAKVLGWEAGEALDVSFSGHWAVFRPAGRARLPEDRRLAHIDRNGRLVIPHGIRTYLGTATGENVILRVDAEAGVVKVANESLLALALDVLERVEAAGR